MDRNTKIDHHRFNSELNRPTTAPPHQPTTVIKYMTPRTIGLNLTNSFQGSLRNFTLPNIDSSLVAPTLTTNYGLVSFVQAPLSSAVAPIQNIDGEHIRHEHRELSKLHETLTDNILLCCHYEVHNRAQELQLELFQANANKNSSIIEKMFQSEIETGHQLITDASRYKSELNKKLTDIHQVTVANDEHYQQLLSKRNTTNKEIFEYQRKLAQNRAESEFLRSRIQQFNDETNFYTLKNNILQTRQVKLRYELDEETFAKQVLEMEFGVLENEKITNEDIHLTTMNDIRQSININQIATIEPSNTFHEQLNYELRRMKSEFERKLQTYRDELHRKFELEYHRYRMQKSFPTPNVLREHEMNSEQFKREKNDIEQQLRFVRENIYQLQSQIEIIEKKILDERVNTESISKSQRHLSMLQQIIRERENQLEETIQIRTTIKNSIENYREELNRYPKRIINNSNETEQSIKQNIQNTNNQQKQSSSTIIQVIPSPFRSKTNQTEEISLEEGTLVRFNDFNVEQDCKELNTSLQKPNIDEMSVIRILCNRTIAQRLQIRDTYPNRFGESLNDVIETKVSGNLKTLLQRLLLSSIEYDCIELRRILCGTKIDETTLIEIFLSRSNKEIKTIIHTYETIFKSTLAKDIIDDEETPSKQIILALLQANRPEDNDIDDDEVLEDAQYLYETNSKWRRDGSTFIRLLCNRSNTHLKQIFDAYPQFSKTDIEQSIQIDKDSDLSHTLMAIVRIVRNRPRFFAFELKKSLKSSGCNEDNLTRIIVSRCEIDMIQIKSEFEKISKRTLFDQIHTDTSGYYKRALLELLRQRSEPISNNSIFKQLLDSKLVQKKTRPTVQWKQPMSKKPFGRSLSNRDIYNSSQFDRNNEAKMNTLLTFNTKPPNVQYTELYPARKRLYSNQNDDE
ncbi:unnamed protein product [Rotaria sordida]|uniref:Annexin n=3 Tax=Rotaria sordida TaxID=392033 RepID=A0A818UKK3_9BILA|nr:unnamed protein product [Rotaria sordida]